MAITNPLEYLTLSKMYSPYRTNPHETEVKTLEAIKGSSGLASPAIGFLQGRAMAKGEDWESARDEEMRAAQENAAEAAKVEGASVQQKRKFDQMKEVFEVYNKAMESGNAGEAVGWLNAAFKKMEIDLPTIDAVNSTPRMEMVHFVDGQGWWGIDKRTRMPMVSTGIPEGGKPEDAKWRVPTQEEVAALQKKDVKLGTVRQGTDEVNIMYDNAGNVIKEVGRGTHYKPSDGGAGTLAKIGNVNAVTQLVAGTWIDQAVSNAKEQGNVNIKEDFSDPITGQIVPMKVRKFLNPEQQQKFDYQLRSAQEKASKMAPAAAEQESRNETMQRFPTSPQAVKANPVIDEMKKRGMIK